MTLSGTKHPRPSDVSDITFRIRRVQFAMASNVRPFYAFLILLMTTDLTAHEVNMVQDASHAIRLSLTYADGSPFAYESYELYPTGADLPIQIGRTDARGQIVFIPDTPGKWRIKAFSTDGHGIDRRFTIQAIKSSNETSACDDTSRLYAIVSGLAVLFGLFGLYQLFFRGRDNT